MVLLNIVCKPTDNTNKFRVTLPQEFHAQQVSLRKSIIGRTDPSTGASSYTHKSLPGNVYVKMPFLNHAHVCSNQGGARLELSYNHHHGSSATCSHTNRHEAEYDVSFYADHIDQDFDIEFFQDPECTKPLPLHDSPSQTEPRIGSVSMTFELSHNETRA